MIILDNLAWAGTEDAFQTASGIAAAINDKLLAGGFDESNSDKPLYQVVGDTAVVPVKGPMLNIDVPDFIVQLFGICTYPTLQRQFEQLKADENIRRVILDVDSGGGSVAGLSETLDSLKALKAVKRVETYAGDTMCSAAYWLASAADEVTVSEAVCTGSIGVIFVHTNYKQAMEDRGVKPTVFRAGSKKVLGHPAEDLTEEAVGEIQKGLDFHFARFKQAVSEHRKIPLAMLEAGIADGRLFYGTEAVTTGLADRIGTFDKVLNAKPFYQQGSFAADSGVSDVNLEEALAKVAELQAKSDADEATLQSAEARAVQAETEKAALEASNKALTGSLAALQADVEGYAANLEANIQAKANALRLEVLIPQDLAGKKALNAQLEEKFQAAFPSGGVAAVAQGAGASEDVAQTPVWAREFLKQGV